MTTTTETTTNDVLKGMLTENCGIHMLDSGMANGRHWQKNQGRDFDAEPATTLRWGTGEYGGPEVTHNVFHWLSERLEFDPEFDAMFAAYQASPENADTCDLEDMEGFAESIGAKYGTVNTYNGEDLLSQVLQYTMFSTDGAEWISGEHVLLQIHGGADVRGGYSRPRAFKTFDECALMSNADASISCGSHGWYTDDGYNWYAHNDESPSTLNPGQTMYRDEVAPEVVEGTVHVPGKVVVTPDGDGLCPICGEVLHASF